MLLLIHYFACASGWLDSAPNTAPQMGRSDATDEDAEERDEVRSRRLTYMGGSRGSLRGASATSNDAFTISTRTVLLVIMCLIGGTVLHALILGSTAESHRDDGPGWVQAMPWSRGGGRSRGRGRRRVARSSDGYDDDDYDDDDYDAYSSGGRRGSRRSRRARSRRGDRWSGGLLRTGALASRLRGGDLRDDGLAAESAELASRAKASTQKEAEKKSAADAAALAAKSDAERKAKEKAEKLQVEAAQRAVYLKRPSPYARRFNWEHNIIDFLHVPKAAGSVVKMVIIEWANHKKMKVAGHNDDFLSMSRKEQTKHMAIWGHRGYGLHRQRGFKTNKRIKYFTFLRDPLARVISQYEYHWAEPARKGLTKEPFIKWFHKTRKNDKANPWHVSNNPNVRQLCCWWSPNGKQHPPERCPPSEKTLQCAKKHVEQMVMVGIQEQLEDGIALLLWRTGMKDYRQPTMKTVNIFHGKKKHVLTPSEEAQVRAALYLDVELYEFVRNKFRLQYLEMVTGQKAVIGKADLD